MKLIKPSFKIIEQQDGLEGIYKQIELAGRTCYKSEDKITETSSKAFVDRMIKSEHGAMLEHGTVYLYSDWCPDGPGYLCKYKQNKYSRYDWRDDGEYVTTNYRVLIENGWLDDLKYICEPTKYHEKRYSVKFVSDIHFYKDTTRHRPFSWAIESTRLCNYIKEKFGASISFAVPIWLKPEEQEDFENDLKIIESIYFKWIKRGWKPEEAAYFLIQGTKAEIFMTGFADDYIHFFDLRSSIAKTGKPHQTVEELVEPLRQEFIKRGYI